MDDLNLIREVFNAPPPSARATGQARSRLNAALVAPQPARRPRRRLLAAAFAMAGIAAFALAVAPPGPRPAPGPQPPDLSARGILLAAAHQAATAEAGTGRYWRVRRLVHSGPLKVGQAPDYYYIVDRNAEEQWIARDPADPSWTGRRNLGSRPRSEADQQAWRKAGSPTRWDLPGDNGSVHRSTAPDKGALWPLNPAHVLVDLGGFDRAQVEALPTDAGLLRELFTARIAAGRGGFAPGTRGSDSRLFGAMCQLLMDVPAPPAVRAAAFTVLAGIAGMRATGEVTDDLGRTGIGIELIQQSTEVSESRRLVVDPATHLLLASSYSANSTGGHGAQPVKEQHQMILQAGWTDAPPAVPALS
ncbi:CU044_5270 family protein [Catellatospora sichuanensis]|uniref:CU044_5270 family protein n=1 Tax=Catellatospora sichuanensis TaxID=1969805 RepID=UPI001182610A|nr:CU044_5270 family protein [Catellatospora sichuanensis]